MLLKFWMTRNLKVFIHNFFKMEIWMTLSAAYLGSNGGTMENNICLLYLPIHNEKQ